MSVATKTTPQITALLCRRLQEIARNEELIAADEAASTPYWAPCPDSAVGHRAAARALREEIRRLENGVALPHAEDASAA